MAADRYTLDPAARALLVDLGLDVAHVLRSAGKPADLLARGPVTLPQDEYFAVWRAMEEVSDEPHLPIRIAELLSTEVFDPTLFSALSAENLNLAATRIAKFKRLVSPVQLEVDVLASGTSLSLAWPTDAVPMGLVATDLLFWVALVRIATRHHVRPLSVTMPEPPEAAGPYAQYLGVRIGRGERPSVTFSAFDARRPFLTANQVMWDAFEPDLRRRLAELEAEATTAERVRAVLIELLPGGDASMEAVADQLAMSGRTLHRRLQNEGTTFKAVLSDTREALALHYLASPSLSTTEISFLLGFQDPSSFFRAFRTWTGETPDRVRARVA